MFTTGTLGHAPYGCCLLFVGALLCSLISCEVSVPKENIKKDVGGKLKIEGGGWSEVKKGWPVNDTDYFLATEKGHHFVESQNLPKNLKHDLKVTFEYYYSYSRTRPVLNMVPCTKNIYLVDESSEDHSNKWITHTYRVNRRDCAKRNELAYNVLLHDAGDVFAWKQMKIESIDDTPKPTGAPRTEAPSTTRLSGEEVTMASLLDDEFRQVTPTREPQIVTPSHSEASTNPATQETSPTITEAPSRDKEQTELPATESPPSQKPVLSLVTRRPASLSASYRPATESPASQRPVLSLATRMPASLISTYQPPTKKSSSAENAEKEEPVTETDYFPPGYPKTRKPQVEDAKENSGVISLSDDNDPADANLNLRRSKRATLSDDDDNEKNNDVNGSNSSSDNNNKDSDGDFTDATCVPSSCNKNMFKMARFSALIKGLPRRPIRARESKYLVNLKNQPLKMKVESSEESLTEVDTCVRFLLYMEPNTELEFLLDDGSAGSKGKSSSNSTTESGDVRTNERLLELIKRKKGDSTAGHWDQFNRCISDYMPQYTTKETQDRKSGASEKDENSMRLVLRPKGAQRPGQVALLIAEQEASYLANLYRKQSFLPDIKRLSDVEDFKRFWVLDRDGLAKPQLAVGPRQALTTKHLTPAQDENERALRITNIDATQETFDLTSRWLQIKDAETLELPILFVYKADEADWIEHVDFEYQRAGDSPNDWISQKAYTSPSLAQPRDATNSSSASSSAGSSADSSKQEDKRADAESSATQPKMIDLPIKLKGLDSNEFRLRLRHHLRAPANNKNSSSIAGTTIENHIAALQAAERTLNIKSLAFADACSYGRPYCQNNGECRPTGAAQAECICAQGFSGRFCEHVRPCDVIYRSGDKQLTGQEMCKSLGARCVDQLPVMRCEWPNDQFYQCKSLFKLDSGGHGYVPVNNLSGRNENGGSPQGGTPSEPQSLIDDDESLSPEARMSKLKSVVGQQAKLIIILAVFIVAILIFAVVLVGSMVSRLRRSSKRLKRTQGEVHELAKRAIHPGGFGGAPSASRAAAASSSPFNRAKSGSPASVIGYNNSAFDVES